MNVVEGCRKVPEREEKYRGLTAYIIGTRHEWHLELRGNLPHGILVVVPVLRFYKRYTPATVFVLTPVTWSSRMGMPRREGTLQQCI
jgi:hypothetical protein